MFPHFWIWITHSLSCLLLFSPQWVGSSCGLHGPYIFYKAFKFHRDGKPRILSLGDFFFVKCKPGDPICIAELQLLWEERTTKQLLSSSKLYFLPEDTPLGRTVSHGEVITFKHSVDTSMWHFLHSLVIRCITCMHYVIATLIHRKLHNVSVYYIVIDCLAYLFLIVSTAECAVQSYPAVRNNARALYEVNCIRGRKIPYKSNA